MYFGEEVSILIESSITYFSCKHNYKIYTHKKKIILEVERNSTLYVLKFNARFHNLSFYIQTHFITSGQFC